MTAKHFKIVELVPPHAHHARGEKAWELIDPRLIDTLDRLRGHYGKMTVNNWYWGVSVNGLDLGHQIAHTIARIHSMVLVVRLTVFSVRLLLKRSGMIF